MGSGINNKINKFFCNPKNVKKRTNTILEKCYGQVNIATAFFESPAAGEGLLRKTISQVTKNLPGSIAKKKKSSAGRLGLRKRLLSRKKRS